MSTGGQGELEGFGLLQLAELADQGHIRRCGVGLAVRSCAMGEYEAVREGIRRAMKEAAHGEIGG